MWNELEYEGDHFGDLPDGGYASVAAALAEGVDVRIGEAVHEVALKPVAKPPTGFSICSGRPWALTFRRRPR
jgi:hypothetical protein